MNEINSKEKMFLGKLKALLDTFDSMDKIVEEINDIIDRQPNEQSRIDQLLSDYYHILENDDLSDEEIINIGKKIHEIRLQRRDENSVGKLIHCYDINKNKLTYSNKGNRQMFYQAIANLKKTLHEDYKYRILTDNDIINLKEKKIKKTKKCKRKYSTAPSLDELIKCLSEGMKNKEISEKFDITPTYVSVLKRKYNLIGNEVI